MTGRRYTGMFQNEWTLAIEERDGLIEAMRAAIQGRDYLIGLYLADEVKKDAEIKGLKFRLSQYDEFIRALGQEIFIDSILKVSNEYSKK